MRKFFVYYLGVTPPSREQEKRYLVLLIGGMAVFVVALGLFARLLIHLMFGS
ncbi:MAG TPA: hypothetical protein VMT82_11795 [candidate division Zixibacteria bacterium]|nr:hypothetical protein [candidate division Zixibacteria bacterium]